MVHSLDPKRTTRAVPAQSEEGLRLLKDGVIPSEGSESIVVRALDQVLVHFEPNRVC